MPATLIAVGGTGTHALLAYLRLAQIRPTVPEPSRVVVIDSHLQKDGDRGPYTPLHQRLHQLMAPLPWQGDKLEWLRPLPDVGGAATFGGALLAGLTGDARARARELVNAMIPERPDGQDPLEITLGQGLGASPAVGAISTRLALKKGPFQEQIEHLIVRPALRELSPAGAPVHLIFLAGMAGGTGSSVTPALVSALLPALRAALAERFAGSEESRRQAASRLRLSVLYPADIMRDAEDAPVDTRWNATQTQRAANLQASRGRLQEVVSEPDLPAHAYFYEFNLVDGADTFERVVVGAGEQRAGDVQIHPSHYWMAHVAARIAASRSDDGDLGRPPVAHAPVDLHIDAYRRRPQGDQPSAWRHTREELFNDYERLLGLRRAAEGWLVELVDDSDPPSRLARALEPWEPFPAAIAPPHLTDAYRAFQDAQQEPDADFRDRLPAELRQSLDRPPPGRPPEGIDLPLAQLLYGIASPKGARTRLDTRERELRGEVERDLRRAWREGALPRDPVEYAGDSSAGGVARALCRLWIEKLDRGHRGEGGSS